MPNERKKKVLKPQHQIVVNEIVSGANQTEAYQKAYPHVDDATARANASRLLTNANISAEIERRKQRAIAHSQVTAEEVLGSAVFNMRASMNDLMDEEGYFDLKKARETGAVDLIKEMEVIESVDLETMKKTVRHKVKFESPAAARKEVANYIGLEKFENKPTNAQIAHNYLDRALAKGAPTDEAIAYICSLMNCDPSIFDDYVPKNFVDGEEVFD